MTRIIVSPKDSTTVYYVKEPDEEMYFFYVRNKGVTNKIRLHNIGKFIKRNYSRNYVP